MFYIGQIFEETFPPEAGNWCNENTNVTINEIEPIQGIRRFQIVKYQSKITIESYDIIMEQHIKNARIARGYTTRQPSDYINSDTPRWKQDAIDFIAFRDKCLTFGQTVINTYQQTGYVPTLQQFKEQLEEKCICIWTYTAELTHNDLIQFVYQQKCRIAYGRGNYY